MKLIKENFNSAIEDRKQRIAAYKARHLKEEKETLTGDVEEKIFRITYRHSPEIFSSFMIKADSEEDARGKAEVKTKGKEIVGVKLMSKDEVHDMKNRGMSIVENVEVDKEDKGRLLIVDYKDGKKDLTTLHKELLDLFNGDYKKAFEFFVTNEDVKLKESEDAPLREDIEIEIDTKEEEIPAEESSEVEEAVPPAPTSPVKMSLANMFSALIRDEWEAIDGYNGTISTIKDIIKSATEDSDYADNSIDYDGIIKVLEDIANEENLHVGQLQKALETVSPNAESIRTGEEEASEQLEEGEVEEVDEVEEEIPAEE